MKMATQIPIETKIQFFENQLENAKDLNDKFKFTQFLYGLLQERGTEADLNGSVSIIEDLLQQPMPNEDIRASVRYNLAGAIGARYKAFPTDADLSRLTEIYEDLEERTRETDILRGRPKYITGYANTLRQCVAKGDLSRVADFNKAID